ncbi:MAG: hypothetical protein QX196_07685, partial [Methylococcaceae bacterium]
MMAFTDENTKPSRLNRKKKRRWKIIDLIKSALTDGYMAAMLTPLLPHVAAGSRNPHKATTGHYKTWFFCTHQKYNSILLWWGVSSNPLKGWPRLGGIANLIHPTAQRFTPMAGGLSLLQG